MGIMGFLEGIIRSSIAAHVPTDILRIIFGLLLIVVSIDFKVQSTRKALKKIYQQMNLFSGGFMTEIASGLLGIRGGVVLVLIMVIILGFKMIEAVETSSLIIAFTSVGGLFCIF